MRCNYNGCSSKCKGDVDANSCNILKAYQQGRADEKAKTIDKTLEIINRKIALLEERLRIETYVGRWVDEEKCSFAIEQLEFLSEQIERGESNG